MNGVVMKSFIIKLGMCAALALLCLFGTAVPASAQDGRVQLGQLDHLTARASETITVNLDEKLMQMAAKFLSGKEPDEVTIKELINGLKGIYVRSFEFEREGEYTAADLASIRTQLSAPAWSKIVNIMSKKEGSLEVYLMSDTSKLGGLTILVSDPKELTIVNIIGPVDLEKLSRLEGKFGIPELDIATPKAKPRN